MPSRNAVLARASVFLIVIVLGVGLFTYFSVKGVGDRDIAPTSVSIFPTPTQALFYDTFLDNRNAWGLSNHGGYLREIANNRLVLTNTNPQTTLIESLPNEQIYGDFTVTITFAMLQGDANDSVGIYVRGDSNLDHDYRIEISGDETFDSAKEFLDMHSKQQVQLLDGPRHITSLLSPGQLNTLKATLQGTMLSVSINNTLISTVSDADYASGQVTLFVRHGSTSSGVTMSVSEIEIDTIGL